MNERMTDQELQGLIADAGMGYYVSASRVLNELQQERQRADELDHAMHQERQRANDKDHQIAALRAELARQQKEIGVLAGHVQKLKEQLAEKDETLEIYESLVKTVESQQQNAVRQRNEARAELLKVTEERDALKRVLTTVKVGLYDNMGLGHCIKYRGRHVELWSKDPNFNGPETGQEIQKNQTLVHNNLVEMAKSIDAVASEAPEQGEPHANS